MIRKEIKVKKFLIILLLLLTFCLLASCGECEHSWTEATCTEPRTCTLCGETEGEASGHSYGEWTTSSVPGCETEGENSESAPVETSKRKRFPLWDTTLKRPTPKPLPAPK